MVMESSMKVACAEIPSPAAADTQLLPAALAELYSAHSRAIYYLALRFLGDPQKAEDATHDVFLKALRHLDQFRGQSSARTWLYRIAINHCKNMVTAWHDRHVLPSSDHEWAERLPAGDSPLRILETKELGGRIQQALDGLPEEYRLLLLLVSDQELSYAEAGALTGQTADAVRGKLFRARKAFGALFVKTE
jgi:RNA polymerase sigma-70 factor (ECF subfamily)